MENLLDMTVTLCDNVDHSITLEKVYNRVVKMVRP